MSAGQTVMALHTRIKLPSLKLTQRSTHGPIRHRTVPRGVTTDSFVVKSDCDSISEPVAPDHNDCGELGAMLSGDNGLNHSGNNEPSLHYIKQKAAVTAWEQNRAAMLRKCIECNAMPNHQNCIMCANEAKYRCLQCASWAFFCSDCFAHAHRTVNIFHVGEIWEVNCTIIL